MDFKPYWNLLTSDCIRDVSIENQINSVVNSAIFVEWQMQWSPFCD